MEKLELLKEIKDTLELSEVNGGSLRDNLNLIFTCMAGSCSGPVPYTKPQSYSKPDYRMCTAR